MEYFFDNIKNNFDFFLRNRLSFSRKNYSEIPKDVSRIFKNEEEKRYYSTLKEKYGNSLEFNTTERIFLENIYFLDIFDKYFTQKISKKTSILDIGSKNWSYVKSEYIFFNSFCKNFNLDGIELDSNRLCSNLYSRYEIAKFYTKDLSNTKYISGDLMEHEQKYDYIIWILPFITPYPLIKWGLPLKYFKPKEMLLHAYNLLNPNGELLIINQGEEEYMLQNELYKNLPQIFTKNYGEIQDKFKLFRNARYCSKIIKQS